MEGVDKPIPGNDRGVLRHVILQTTGQDVRNCMACDLCDGVELEGTDLTLGEIIRAAGRDEALALANASRWEAEDLIGRRLKCQAGLDIPSIILTLRRESDRRGLSSSGPSAKSKKPS